MNLKSHLYQVVVLKTFQLLFDDSWSVMIIFSFDEEWNDWSFLRNPYEKRLTIRQIVMIR